MARYRKTHRSRRLIGVIAVLLVILVLVFAAVTQGPVLLKRLGSSPEEPSEEHLEETLPQEIQQTPDSYFLPTDQICITAEDLDRFPAEEIPLIRNEIYARHGYDFQDADIRAYFDQKSWYEPIPGAHGANFDASGLNEYEAANIALILAYEKGERMAERLAEAETNPGPETGPEPELLGSTQNPPLVIWTEHLNSREDVKTYDFQMQEPGDVVILATGLQEVWDGYPYHWYCAVLGDDPETPLAGDSVRGYCVNDGPAVLSLPNLEAGIYRIRMTGVTSGNPFMTTFTADPFEIRLIRHYHTAEPLYASEGVQTFHSANELVWALDGTGFLKLNDGECFGALMRSNAPDRALIPVLFSTDPASVEYIVSSTGERVKAAGPWHCPERDVDYYYSDGQYVKRYTDKTVDKNSLPIPYIDTNGAQTAVEAIVTMEEDAAYKAEHGDLKFWWSKHGGKVKAVLGVVAVLTVLGLLGGAGGGGGGGGFEADATGSLDEAISAWWADGM